MRVTVCEMHDDVPSFERDWEQLVDHVGRERSDVVLLPEMPFSPWFAGAPAFDAAAWRRALDAHDRWLARLGDLSPATVLGTRPVERGGRRVNEAFAWSASGGYRGMHVKAFLPCEEGFWESYWYEPGDDTFEPDDVAGARVGFQICTELWSMGHAQRYGRRGVHVIATPRATSKTSVDKWLAGGRVAAIVAGAYSLSSNRSSAENGPDFGGGGWVIGPDGDVLAVTDRSDPIRTVALELAVAERAKGTYPRYALAELPVER
jgi:N-carbamoylputrescine amidase